MIWRTSGQRRTPSLLLAVTPLSLHFSAAFFSAMEGIRTVFVCVDADNLAVIAGRTIPVTVSVIADSAQG